MKKVLIIVMALAAVFAFAGCGGSDEPTAYEPTDIQVEDADGVNVYSVVYDIENDDTEQWSGYDTNQNEVDTAVNGIKECMGRDDWTDGSIVYGYAGEPKLEHMLYSYGYEGDYTSIGLYQLGIYNDSYTLQGELD